MEIFGFEINRKKQEQEEKKLVSFAPPTTDDGAMTVSSGGVYGTYVDLDGSVRTESELVSKYRTMSIDPTVDLAIQDICNEAIIEDSDEDTVSIVLDDVDTKDNIKKKIQEEFQEVLKLLEFNRLSYEIFRRWYVDGRLYYHVMIDESQRKKGIRELRYIDPRHIKKVKEVSKEKNADGVTVEKLVGEYYVYNPNGFIKRSGVTQTYGTSDNVTTQALKISKDSISYCTSGYMDPENKFVLSYLHKAIRPLNQLRSMEDSLVIYRISRAPERRIFYVDVGGLPKAKAEQYLSDLMTKFKNKTVYDSTTGEIRDDRKFMTMLEDFWLPRREGGRGTEITTLPGGQNLGEIEDIEYFQKLLYKSLNVPVTRMLSESSYTMGRATEISRDEVKFGKFITRLRSKFAELFTSLLERQLILKGICTVEDWAKWKHDIQYAYAIDNYFAELKSIEITRERLSIMRDMDEYVGKYYSHEHVRRYILRQNDDEMSTIDSQIKKEKTIEQYNDPDMMGDQEQEQEPTPQQPAPEPKAVDIRVTTDAEKSEVKKEELDAVTQSQLELLESMTRYIESE